MAEGDRPNFRDIEEAPNVGEELLEASRAYRTLQEVTNLLRRDYHRKVQKVCSKANDDIESIETFISENLDLVWNEEHWNNNYWDQRPDV